MTEEMKTLVIGGSGFLGSHLADALSNAGYEVTVFDRRPSPWLRAGQRMLLGDIMDYNQVHEAVQGMGYIYHLAGLADISLAAAHPRQAIEANIIGSTNVFEASVAAKVTRVLFASTLYVYSQQGSFYRVSKQAAESILVAFNERFGLEYTILRYGSLYGPRAQEWNGLKSLVVQAVRDGRIVYPGTGQERREYIHVHDAAKLSVQALSPDFRNNCLTLTGTQVLSTHDVLYMIREIASREIEIEFRPAGDVFEQFHYSLTPYRYTPRRGVKVVPSTFIDLGQGILDLIEEVDQATNGY